MFRKHFMPLACGFLFVLVLMQGTAFSQKKKGDKSEKVTVKFGEIALTDFDPELHAFDTTADAVVLYDKGISSFKESKDGWFVLMFERHQRIKILKKNGLDAANFIIPQYKSAKSEEKIDKLKASTFNLDGGKVVETKLNEKDIFKDQLNKNYSLTKFGLPNVKEGSIIEVTYIVQSDFLFNLRPWEFQGSYPRVHTEYTTRIPEFFVYIMLNQGFLPFTDKQTKSGIIHFNLNDSRGAVNAPPERISLTTTENENRWVMKDVPALKPEPFTTTIDNFVSKISFQLSEYRFPNQPAQPVMSSWPKVSEELLNDEEFGAYLSKNNGWLNEDVKKITAEAANDLEKAKSLYAYMREKFSLKTTGGKYMTDNPRNVWKNMKGNTADANIMLTILLRSAGLSGDPVMLSTRDNGFSNDAYPIMSQYNYVVCRTEIDGKEYYLDATNPMLGFGFLPLECYNGHARVIKTMTKPVYLEANNLKETKTTIINLFGSDENPWEGKVDSKLGYYESLSFRERLKVGGQDKIERDMKNALPAEIEMGELKIEELKDYDKPVKVKYDLNFENLKEEDIIYLNPLLGEITKENPFTAAERMYPVEMPYAFKETILSNIVVPVGYELDEMPKPTRVVLDDNQGMFEYLIQQSDGRIQLRCVLELKKANFEQERYSVLRDFFTYVVKKQSEQIVFKKKS